MSARHYHKRYHSDALSGFMALTLEERGAYQTLLDMMYDRQGPLIDNERLLAGYMNCSIRKWRQLREDLIAKGKIRINSAGQITNDRAEKEIESASKTHRKLIESGAKGGRVSAEIKKKANENSETDEASLKGGSSPAQAIPDTRYQRKRDTSVSPKRGLPDGWEPQPFGPETDTWQILAGWSIADCDRELAAFRDHHRAKGSKFSDWQAAWGTWVRNSHAFSKRNAGWGSGGEQRNFEDVVLDERKAVAR
jgi:uncharacterized protein YdaU (DUF1376 family)